MKWWLAAFLCVALEAGARADKLKGYVLVWQGSWLSSAPRADAPRARVIDLPDTAFAADDQIDDVFVMRVVAEHGEYVEVENLDDPYPTHCYGGVAALSPFRLHLFVPRAALRAVTSGPASAEFKNGTGFKLAPGVALGADAAGVRTASVDGVMAQVKLPASSVGWSYAGPGRKKMSGEPVGNISAADAKLVMGAAEELGVTKTPDGMAVRAHKKVGDRRLLTLATGCATYTVLTENDDMIPGSIGAMSASASSITDVAQVAANATLYWPDGSQAGKTLAQTQLLHRVTRDGKRRCFDWPLRPDVNDDREKPDQNGIMILCVDEKDYLPGYGER